MTRSDGGTPTLDAVRAAPAHPLTWVAGATILVNDFFLRDVVPGWWTGKLSDLGWLVVAPVLLGAGAVAVGMRRGVRSGAIGLTVAFYALLQLWPPLGAWFSTRHVADAGDLLALPALWIPLWLWRRPAAPARRWTCLAVPALTGVLLADSRTEFPPGSAPCGPSMSWPPEEPLRLWLNGWGDPPVDSEHFLEGMRLTDAAGRRLALVAARTLDGVAVCAREGLEPDADYTWAIGPWTGFPSNEVPYTQEALPVVRFHTTAGTRAPATDPEACFALASTVPAGVIGQCDPARTADSSHSGDTADTSESGDTGDSGDTSDSGDTGDSGDTSDSGAQ